MMYYGSVAPVVVKDKLILGPSGDDLDVPAYLEARSPENGELIWRWYVTPQKEGDAGLDTWPNLDMAQARRRHDVAADHLRPGAEPDLRHDRATRSRWWPSRTARAPTSSPRRSSRSNADTGKMVWYFQSSPHDTHDWDATQTRGPLRRHDQRPAAQADRAGLAQRPVLRARSHHRQGDRLVRVHQDQLERSATTRRDSRFRIRTSGRRSPARWSRPTRAARPTGIRRASARRPASSTSTPPARSASGTSTTPATTRWAGAAPTAAATPSSRS